jgi:enamine deaminase RidA (YjgF/YER057c/UK114 family)
MLRALNASDAPQPIGGYAQAVEVRDPKRWLVISGQIPLTAAGIVPETFAEQADLVWSNVVAQLRAADMTVDNLVKVTIFLSDRKYIPEYRAARLKVLGSRTPALTCIITGIFDPAWLIEVEATAVA